ncbi:unnamed protein product [Adineta steineri]|uniref:PX domain-containing protein n=2 Tax=Adineta steineri TaxID=433720 RepID=A0A819Z597_9BILA|nr:unnamed protein product [Adineta steineri]
MFSLSHIYDQNDEKFMPNVLIDIISIVAEQRNIISTDFDDLYQYRITIQHGLFQWKICKLYQHFIILNNALTKLAKDKRRPRAEDESNSWPSIPISKDKLIDDEDNNDPQLCQLFSDYLNNVVRNSKCRTHPATASVF